MYESRVLRFTSRDANLQAMPPVVLVNTNLHQRTQGLLLDHLLVSHFI